MKIDLGPGSALTSKGVISIKYDIQDEENYTISDIDEDELIVEGFKSSEVYLKNIKSKIIFIKCFSPVLHLEDIECDTLFVEHPDVRIIDFSGKALTINAERLYISEIHSNEININLNMEINGINKDFHTLYFNCDYIKAKVMKFFIHRRKDWIEYHSIKMNQVKIDDFTLNAYGFDLRFDLLSCVFKKTNIHLDLDTVLIGHEARQYMHINTLEAFAKCIFTPEEFKEVLKYHRHKPILK